LNQDKKTTRYTLESPVKLWALIAQERALTGKTTNQIIIERLTESYDEVFIEPDKDESVVKIQIIKPK
jgi:hypothetical protein